METREYVGIINGLHIWGLGLHWGYIGIMENKMETTIMGVI